jgi:hydrogenase expression/formation protein HypC
MCLPLPFQVAELLDNDMARVTLGDVSEIVSLEMIEDAHVGDYVILHGTCALTKLDVEDARELLVQINEAGAH